VTHDLRDIWEGETAAATTRRYRPAISRNAAGYEPWSMVQVAGKPIVEATRQQLRQHKQGT
jgi:hypothetical protein